MSFLESICLKDGAIQNLDYHQKRLDYTLKQHGFPRKWNLKEQLASYELPQKGIYKVRAVYDWAQLEITWQAYQIRPVQSLKVLPVNQLDYTFKRTDRNNLKTLFDQRGTADDIIIAKKGWVTDSYYANLGFFRKGQWHTPDHPLLSGTKRQSLIDQKRLLPTPIRVEEILNYEKVALINALIDLEDQVWIPTDCVYF